MTVSIALMAHQSRMASVRRLAPQVQAAADAFLLSVDYGQYGKPWPNAEACWTWGVEAGCDWHLVLQDDALLCHDFGRHLREALAVFARPELVTLFHHSYGTPRSGGGWAASYWLSGAVAVVLGTSLIAEFLNWQVDQIRPEVKQDDLRLSLWAMEHRRVVWITNPNLVQHGIGRGLGTSVNDPASRRSVCFAGLLPFMVDWTRGRERPQWMPLRSAASYGDVWRNDA